MSLPLLLFNVKITAQSKCIINRFKVDRGNTARAAAAVSAAGLLAARLRLWCGVSEPQRGHAGTAAGELGAAITDLALAYLLLTSFPCLGVQNSKKAIGTGTEASLCVLLQLRIQD